MRLCFQNDHLQRWPDAAAQKMPAMRGPVGFPNHYVRVEHWFAVLLYDISRKREYLDLLLHCNRLVILLRSIKEAEGDFAKRADRRDLRSAEPIFTGKPQQRLFHVLIFLKYEGERFQTLLVLQQFRFHTDVAGIK